MIETQWQKTITEAVRKLGGGWAYKQSNRFLVGVPDIYVQLPGMRAGIHEVKLSSKPKRSDTMIRLDVTPAQMRHLRENVKAGGISSVISIIEGPDDWGIRAFKLDELPGTLIVSQDQHSWSDTRSAQRLPVLLATLKDFHERY